MKFLQLTHLIPNQYRSRSQATIYSVAFFAAYFCIVANSCRAETESKPASEKPSASTQNVTQLRKLDENEQDEQLRFGLGYAFFGTFRNDGQIGSLSAMLDINPVHSIQVIFGVGSVKEQFNFGTGAIYRATVSGDRNLGFHLGGLVNLGTSQAGKFNAQVGPLLGIHVAVFQLSQLQLSLDGGPLVTYQNGPDLKVSPVGNGMVGLSAHYFF